MLDEVEVVVEGARRGRRGIQGQAGAHVILGRPGARSAAHGDAGQHDRLPVLGGALDPPAQDHRGGGHHKLEAVLGAQAGAQQVHVLRAGADVDGEEGGRGM